MNYEQLFRYDGEKKLSLKDKETKFHDKSVDKERSIQEISEDIVTLTSLQDKLYADKRFAVLLVFQAMDSAGKDSTIKHVMSGINPEGCQVNSFKVPTPEEEAHDYLWRTHKKTPEKGMIGIFNRSYYEEVLVTKVHPELILKQQLPGVGTVDHIDKKFWKGRYGDIVNFEDYLHRNGTVIIKFFLHLSKEEQDKRFLARINDDNKNWKFSDSDMKERTFWESYQKAYQDAIEQTSTKVNPWYVVPADEKWFLHLAVSKIIAQRLANLKINYPKGNLENLEALKAAKKILLQEKQ